MPWPPVTRAGDLHTKQEHFRVVAGILVDPQGRVLLAERVGDHSLAGLWEFPGGKIAAEESSATALERELAEEIGVRISEFRPCLELDYDYPDRRVSIEFFLVSAWHGEPQGLEGQGLGWFLPRQIDPRQLLPANAPVLDWLQSNMGT